MGLLKFKPSKLLDPSGIFTGDVTTKSLFDPGGEVINSAKLDRITDPGGFFAKGIAAPTSKPGDLNTAFRRPIEQRLRTDLFSGVTGPTDALTELRQKRLGTQRGIPSASAGITAAARALLVGSTGKNAAQLKEEARLLALKTKKPAATKAFDLFGTGAGGEGFGGAGFGSGDDSGDGPGGGGHGGTGAT